MVDELKGLGRFSKKLIFLVFISIDDPKLYKFSGQFLETKPLNNTVVVFGAVGSTSTVETICKSALGVFVEETVRLCLLKSKRQIIFVKNNVLVFPSGHSYL